MWRFRPPEVRRPSWGWKMPERAFNADVSNDPKKSDGSVLLSSETSEGAFSCEQLHFVFRSQCEREHTQSSLCGDTGPREQEEQEEQEEHSHFLWKRFIALSHHWLPVAASSRVQLITAAIRSVCVCVRARVPAAKFSFQIAYGALMECCSAHTHTHTPAH